MPLWEEVACALIVVAIFGNLAYWLFFAKGPIKKSDVEEDDQTFSM